MRGRGTRLDVALVAAGLAGSRSRAAAGVRAGRARVDGRVVLLPASAVPDGARLELEADDRVSRAGGKLAAALDAFGVAVSGLRCLDLGASTGGFTQELLARGASSVVALDVGHGQLVPSLRADARVTVLEGENARHLTAGRLAAATGDPRAPDLVAADLSFISLTLVLPAIVRTAPRARVICLIKPQFEVGRERIGSGVVHEPADRAAAIGRVLETAEALGLITAGLLASPLPGEHGNREALALLEPGAAPSGAQTPEWDLLAVATAGAAGGGTA